MNIKEAIEKLQKRIGNMQIVLNEMGLQILKHGVTESLNHEIYSDLESEIEALSIVLESAKLFHKVAEITPVYGGEMKLNNLNFEEYYLDEAQTKAIGLEYEILEENE